MRRVVRTGIAIVVLVGATQSPPTSAGERRPLDLLHCIQPVTRSNPVGLEGVYGPTHITAVTGNGHLTSAENAQGTLTVLRWPSPSYWDHVKYLTTDRGEARWGARPNEGVFSGVRWQRADGSSGFAWLRDAPHAGQRFAGDRTDTVVTTFELDDFEVTVTDTVDPDGAALVRHHRVEDRSASLTEVRFVTFANLNPTAKKYPGIPLYDGCLDQFHDGRTHWDAASDAVVHEVTEHDTSTRRTNRVAISLGWVERSSSHDVGPDRHALPLPFLSGGRDPFDAVDRSGGHLLDRDGPVSGQTGSALATDRTVVEGEAEATLVLAFAPSGIEANALLDSMRTTHDSVAARKEAWWDEWLAPAALPATSDQAVLAHALRALICLRQVIDPATTAIVASVSTQPPYALDWPRDGAYFNEVLYSAGHPEVVAAHNRFYARTIVLPGQRPPGAGSTPIGNWPMNMSADGTVGGPIPFEIDETGFGLYTLARHYNRTQDGAYLEDVWPAIRAAADFLTQYRNPISLLPWPAFEDDNLTLPNPPTLVSSATVLLGIREAATAAASADRPLEADRWQRRADELDGAMNIHYGSGTRPFDGPGGDYLFWPVPFRSYDDARMQAAAARRWAELVPSFAAPTGGRSYGSYEAKGLLGLAHAWQGDAEGLGRVRAGLAWLATADVTPGTGLTGEAWYVRDGSVVTAVAPPHVWGMSLFYLTSLTAYPVA
ncbi:MAG: hypothetical protein IT198_15330 [Acidimicrobiia bacterium]|nr:hypothetical protein [Acidimicrobiia bacterium]